MEDTTLPAPCALWPVDLKLTHTDCSPGNILIHFQGQYASVCELDYNILQVEIQNVPKTNASLEVGELCLVEDLLSSCWYRGRIQDKSGDVFSVFLLDHGNILTAGPNHLSTISDSLLMLPPKIVCGFIANVLPVQESWDQPSEAYFSSLVGRQIKGYIHGLLPCKVLILEVPEITEDLLRLNLGRHVDTDTFLLLMELVVEVPIQQSCESVPDLLVEKQIAQEICFKSPNVCGYRNIISLGGSNLAVGQKENVTISAAINPGLFYCQSSSAAKDLTEMSDKLALACESRNSDFKDKSGENIGLLCAIKGKDEKWHRGLVQCLPVNSQVRVVFVDYGYCESVKVENIFQLPSEFLLRPVAAFPCSLSCLGDKDSAKYNQQLVLLREGLLGKALEISLVHKEKNVCSVTLSNMAANVPAKTTKEVNQMASNDILPTVHQRHSILDEMKIPNGSVFEGYVEHVQSPHDFWMRTAKTNDRFVAMMNKLSDRFSRIHLNQEILEDPVIGQFCCAMHETDMHYYRAIVVDVLEYGAEVFFIDFGDTEKVPSMLVKKIPIEFTVEPGFAFNCSLSYINPLEDVWTDSVTDYFRKNTSNKAFLVHVLHKRNGVLVVELFEKGSEKRESLATVLTSADMAEYWSYSAVNPPEISVGKHIKTFNRSSGGLPDKKSSKNIAQKAPTKRQKSVATDEQVHAETEKCIGGEIFKSQKFTPGDIISVQCSHIGSPSDFWCQNKKTKDDLDRLMERLQTFYRTNTSTLGPQSVCCAVKFPKDNKWYRGGILGRTDPKVNVILVDYGLAVQEELKNLRAINPEFLELEKQAFRCSLYNLTDLFGEDLWTDDATTLLKQFTSKSLALQCKIYSQVYVLDKGLCSMVDLWTPFQRASSHLISKGVAKKSPNRLLPSVSPCSFVYSSFDVKIGTEESVFPTHVVSPWEIYLQLDRNAEIIDQLMDRATEESEAIMRKTHTGEPESVCLAKYSEDGKWYRSSVWPARSSLHYNVFFVDYGGKQVAEKKNVLPIPLEAMDLILTPMQALRCSLVSVPEEEPLSEVNAWLENAILNKELQAKFMKTDGRGHFLCDLFDGGVHINAKVRTMLANHKQVGKSVKKPIERCRTELASNRLGSVGKSERNPGHSKVMQGSRPCSQKKPPRLKNSGRSQKEKPVVPIAQPSKGLPKVCDLPPVKIVPGSQSIGFISHWNSASSFFIQLERDEDDLLKMRKELNSSPFTKSFQSGSSNVKAGDLVAARYDEDGALYRAKVNSVASIDYLNVEFIDYGNTATVHKKKIYALATTFLSKARVSIDCRLSKACNSKEVGSILGDQSLMVEFVKNLGHAWEVNIQALEPLHGPIEPDDSGLAKERQELYVAALEDTIEVAVIKEESRTTSLKVVQEETLEKMQATRSTRGKQKFRPNSKCKPGKEPDFPQTPEIHIGVEPLDTSNKPCGPIDSNTSADLPKSGEVDGQSVQKGQLGSEYCSPASVDASSRTPMDKVEEIRRLFLAPVRKDQEYSGFAAAVSTPGDFYIVLQDSFLIMGAVSNALEDLPKDLSPLPESHLIPGTSCLVHSEEKKKWCRAEVVQRDDVAVIVNLVDYGYRVCLANRDVFQMKALPLELAGFPKITYPCRLRGIKPADGAQWSIQAAMFFQQCMCQKPLKIHFRQCITEAQWEVDVATSDKNAAKELVDAGHALYVDTVLEIRFQRGVGHKSQIISNSFVQNLYKAVSHKRHVQRGYLKDASLNDEEDISRASITQGETEDPTQEQHGKHTTYSG